MRPPPEGGRGKSHEEEMKRIMVPWIMEVVDPPAIPAHDYGDPAHPVPP